MNYTIVAKKRRRGRPPGSSLARATILQAATTRFAAAGYRGATMRAIAAEAGVDAALVHHYFRNKAELFAATLSLPEDTTERIIAALRSPAPGEKIVREFLDSWDAAIGGSGLAALMRTAEPGAERRLSELIGATIVTPVTGAIGATPGLPRLRAALVAAHLTGLAWLRYVMKAEPVASASSALLARTYGPAVSATLAPCRTR